MSLLHYLLLADLAEMLRVAMPIIFLVLYGIAHLVGSLQRENRKREGRPRTRPAPPELARDEPVGGVRDPDGGKPQTLEATLRREVEEFLRRAQGEPAQQPAKEPKAPRRPPQRQAAARGGQPESARSATSAEPASAPRRLVEEKSLSAAPLRSRESTSAASQPVGAGLPTGVAVDAYVTQQMRGVQAIGQHAQRLGEEVAQADERLEAHLQQVFTHQVGTLAPVSASNVQPLAASKSAAAQEFRELLARPGGIRQLIIANEILCRPEERWNE